MQWRRSGRSGFQFFLPFIHPISFPTIHSLFLLPVVFGICSLSVVLSPTTVRRTSIEKPTRIGLYGDSVPNRENGEGKGGTEHEHERQGGRLINNSQFTVLGVAFGRRSNHHGAPSQSKASSGFHLFFSRSLGEPKRNGQSTTTRCTVQ